MNGGRKLLVMVLVGVLVATGIIAGVTAAEQGGVLTSGSPTSTITKSITSTTTTLITSSTIKTGVLAAQMTDPPAVPLGTSHLFINYSDIEAHTVDSNNNSVWFTVANAGIIDLMTVVNVGVTLGSSIVTSGVFDQARFDITNATITYYGKNYTAMVPLNQLIVPLANGGVTLAPNSSAGFLIQITPTVLVAQGRNVPSFELVPATKGFAIPPEVWNESLIQTGSKIQNITTISGIGAQSTTLRNNLTVIAKILSSNFLLLALNNTGASSVTISAMNIIAEGVATNPNVSTTTIVSTITTVTTITEIVANTSSQAKGSPSFVQHPFGDKEQEGSETPTFNASSQQTLASFQILSNGSITQPNPRAILPPSFIGLTIKPKQTIVLLFTGSIITLNNQIAPYQPLSIIGGQQYTIQIVNPYGATFEFQLNASYQL